MWTLETNGRRPSPGPNPPYSACALCDGIRPRHSRFDLRLPSCSNFLALSDFRGQHPGPLEPVVSLACFKPRVQPHMYFCLSDHLARAPKSTCLPRCSVHDELARSDVDPWSGIWVGPNTCPLTNFECMTGNLRHGHTRFVLISLAIWL